MLHLGSYTPRLSAEWELDAPETRWQELDATCCFVDISGFTALSERLARRGRIGAEELTEVLNHVFSRMLGVAYSKGGALLKFGGDALLLAFTRDDHATLAAQAAVAMRAALREARTLPTSVGSVNLKMSVGVHSGSFHLFRVGSSHQELLISGPAASTTTRMEQIADAGEIVISDATAARLPRTAVGERKDAGWLLKWRQVVAGGPGPIPARQVSATAVENTIPVALRHRLTDRPGESEHRLASVGFVKFQGVDDLLNTAGPEATAVALDAVVSAVEIAADAESVTFLASDIDANGGKIILVTGVPSTQEDDEGRMLRAARAVIEQPLPLPVRIGVNRGHVFSGDIGTEFRRTFTIMGDTVNLAARLMAAAAPGDLYATASVLDYSRSGFATEALEPFMVKGKSQPVQAYRVGPSTGLKGSTFGALPFLGRDEEMSELLERFKATRDGHGEVVLIEAERGVGKTRLLAELTEAATPQSVLVLQGEGYGTAVPYLPLRAPLRALAGIHDDDRLQAGRQLLDWMGRTNPDLIPLAPLLAPMVDAEVDPTPETASIAAEFVRDRMADALVALLDSAYPLPLLVVAEDAHWFDEATTEMCAALASAARKRPWLLVATRRPETGGFTPADPDLRVNLALLSDQTARELVNLATDSAPLRPAECEGIVARTGGNPLFLEELVRIVRTTDVGSLPDSLDAVAMREIDSLPAGARRVILLASVLGRSFDPGLLARLAAEDDIETGTGLLNGLEMQLVPDTGDRIRFRHAVLQEAAYQSLPFRVRLGLHQRAAEAIEHSAAEVATVAALLSLHFVAAQDWEQTWRYSRMAASDAMAGHAPAEAAVQLERAVTAARHLRGAVAEQDLAAVLTDQGTMLELLGEYQRADDALRRAAGVTKHDPVRRASLTDRRAHLRSEYLGKQSAAIRQLRAGMADLATAPDSNREGSSVRAQLYAREAHVRYRQGRMAEALECSTRAIGQAERAGNRKALALALSLHDICLIDAGRAAEAVYLPRALDMYESLGDQVHVAVTLNNLAAVEFYGSRWDGAADYLLRAIEASTMAGDPTDAAFSQINLSEVRVNQGRLEEAQALLTSARRVAESCGYRLLVAAASMELGRVRAFLGDIDAGVALLETSMAIFDDIHSAARSLEGRARLAEVLLFGGRNDAANQALVEAQELERKGQETPLSPLVARLQLTLAAMHGDPTDALALVAGCLDRARRLGVEYEVLVVLTIAGHLGARDGAEEAARLRRDLGVVRLPMLPWD
jgi:class 3 adenylate cyclase/tetratricopeptide (TPR) repeat protein